MVDSKTNIMEDQLNGNHETQLSECGEADLHKLFDDCKKNPGHEKFISIDAFTLNHLPEGFRDNDLHEYIKDTADLTVRVAVNMTSPHRPEFWPNTKVPYPFYNMEEKTTLRTGSGMVSGVDKFTDRGKKCWCKQCKHSETASHVWWEFDVYTAAHVVFDEIEAIYTSIRLFYDREDAPLVSVHQVIVASVDIEKDKCVLNCVTCDTYLGHKLDMLCRHYDGVRWNIKNKFRESQNVDKLNFIVSHPHGCCKQVSVGEWVEKYKVCERLNKFTYTTCTCPGSSGARVHCLVCDDDSSGWWLYRLVHSGSLNSTLNYSSIGQVL